MIIVQIGATFLLTGVIWVIQIVQYPFFSYIEKADFRAYHAAYTFWITPIVAPLMIAELFTSILILFYPPAYIDYKLLVCGLILTVAVWLSTMIIQVPLHNQLAAGFDAETHDSLVKTNWIRTIAWSLRAVLVLFYAWKGLRF